MFEFVVLLIGAFPFLVGLYAIKMMRQRDDDEADDQPPPPDPSPPPPVSPPAPRHRLNPVRLSGDRPPVGGQVYGMPDAPARLRRS